MCGRVERDKVEVVVGVLQLLRLGASLLCNNLLLHLLNKALSLSLYCSLHPLNHPNELRLASLNGGHMSTEDLHAVCYVFLCVSPLVEVHSEFDLLSPLLTLLDHLLYF